VSYMDGYVGLLTGQIDIPSWLMAIVPGEEHPPGISDVSARARASLGGLKDFYPAPDEAGPAGQWCAKAQVDWDGQLTDYTLRLSHNDELTDFHFEQVGFSAEDQDAAMRSDWVVVVETVFGEDVLVDFHRQLKVVSVVAPDSPAVLDAPACSLRPGSWVREAAGTETPPDPMNLFSIHAVGDDQDERAEFWLHTHGLLRSRSVELEMTGIDREHVGNMSHVMNAMALACLAGDCPPPDVPFEVVAGMPLVWLPFEKAIRKVPAGTLGGRNDRDEFHSHPSAVLLRRGGFWPLRRYRSLNAYGPMLDDDPLMNISTEETQRMARLAREKLDAFVQCFGQYGQLEEWVFLMKFGYTVDGAETDDDCEHLWFQVHTIEPTRVEATLVNQPYDIARMNEGDRGWHDLDLLTDWTILCAYGRFGPDRISLLAGEIAKGPPPE